MTYQHACLLMKTMIIVKSFTILLLSCIAIKLACCFSTSISSLKAIPLVGHLEFEDVYHASKDFGNQYQYIPLAVLHPKAVSDIASAIRNIGMMGPHSQLTVAARGRGHSLQGQAQTRHGIVIHMQSLRPQKLSVHSVGVPAPYVEVSGGELWINILHETLKHSLAPKSWTDYLHLTVGGTLSNAGISGQAFRHGPQISNVLQLEIVTGKGEILNCSERQNSDLFHGVLGGLGQFGIITRARIALDFSAFSTDQESLISAGNKFDYIEGFVIINRTGLLNNWSLSFTPEDPLQASKFKSEGRTLYCLEVAKYFNLNWSRWDNRTSAVTPEEEIFYLVAILTSAVPGSDGVEQILKRNRRVIEFSEGAGIGLKQYLPHYTTREEWRSHFGAKWDDFVRRKSRYDPLGMLAPGHRIF